MRAEIDGTKIQSESDFHREIACALKFSPYYGRNLNALWDTLSTDIERPVRLTWRNAQHSERSMPEKYLTIIHVLRDVEKQDKDFGWSDRFELILD